MLPGWNHTAQPVVGKFGMFILIFSKLPFLLPARRNNTKKGKKSRGDKWWTQFFCWYQETPRKLVVVLLWNFIWWSILKFSLGWTFVWPKIRVRDYLCMDFHLKQYSGKEKWGRILANLFMRVYDYLCVSFPQTIFEQSKLGAGQPGWQGPRVNVNARNFHSWHDKRTRAIHFGCDFCIRIVSGRDNDKMWHNVMNLQISEGFIFVSFAKCHKIQYIVHAPPPSTSTALFLMKAGIFGRGLQSKCMTESLLLG